MSPIEALAAHRTARYRFVFEDITINGEQRRQISDPVLGISMSAAPADAAILPLLFRGMWTQHLILQDSAKS